MSEEKYKDEINTLYEQLRQLDKEYAERQNSEAAAINTIIENYKANLELAKKYNQKD